MWTTYPRLHRAITGEMWCFGLFRTELCDITHQNAELVEQVATAAVSLEGPTRGTYETVRVFRLEGAAEQQPEAHRDGASVTRIKGYPQAQPGALPLKMATKMAGN
ncbi:hypothetical protein AKI39_21370 [Bordetella sp. H567]|uniref:hypothetical protein n=1 Tax=Bordetella sp. H567 TaxID=1697043 RepID=UPI00081D1181|nr:hypothetical protein [Bordetella sp. H567]AOB32745.1 hypothetical protein AKI39_21370 [Bordetella sp. H567]